MMNTNKAETQIIPSQESSLATMIPCNLQLSTWQVVISILVIALWFVESH